MAFSWTTCKPRLVPQPIFVGDARIAGKITAGAVSWEPGQDPAGSYYIVTPALIKKIFALALQNSELLAEIKKLQAKEK